MAVASSVKLSERSEGPEIDTDSRETAADDILRVGQSVWQMLLRRHSYSFAWYV